MTSYRLRYTPGTHDGDRFPLTRYPAPTRPAYPTRERAEQVLAAMPRPGVMEVVSEEDE